MKKQTSFILILVMIAASAFFFWISQNSSEKWQTYNKIDHEKIESYPTTNREVEEHKLPIDIVADSPGKKKKTTREPAAVSKAAPKGREVINPSQKKLAKNITAKNKVSAKWKERLGQNLLRFLRPDTTLFVKKQKSVSLVEYDGIRHAEVVIIQLKSPEGRRYSYNAYVDSESGQVLQTWNRTIHEFYGQKPKKLSPTGIIREDGSSQF